MSYSHTQRSPLDTLLFIGAFAMMSLAFWLHDEAPAFYACVLASAGMLFGAGTMGRLTVEDDGDALLIRFGPLPIFRKRIGYARITAARSSRSSIIDGWGIHWVPGRGWTYNLWGFDCVELTVDGKTLRIGTDDPEGLATFLNTKIKSAGV